MIIFNYLEVYMNYAFNFVQGDTLLLLYIIINSFNSSHYIIQLEDISKYQPILLDFLLIIIINIKIKKYFFRCKA